MKIIYTLKQKIMIINLGKYKTPSSSVFTGRPQGEQVRLKLNLDKLDKGMETVTFLVPIDTTSINPSFFLGLLFKSYKTLKQEFSKKYNFEFETNNLETKEVLQKNIDDGLRNAENSVNINYKNLL